MKFIKRYYKSKIFIGIVGVCVGCLVVLGISSVVKHEQKATALRLNDIGELITQEAYVTEVNDSKASGTLFGIDIPFTQSHFIYSYDFVVKAGYQVEDIVPEVNEIRKIVCIRLPKTQILSIEPQMDSLRVFLEDESVFKKITLKDNNDALNKLMEDAKATAIENGILESAQKNAETLLTGMFSNQFSPNKYKYTYIFED